MADPYTGTRIRQAELFDEARFRALSVRRFCAHGRRWWTTGAGRERRSWWLLRAPGGWGFGVGPHGCEEAFALLVRQVLGPCVREERPTDISQCCEAGRMTLG